MKHRFSILLVLPGTTCTQLEVVFVWFCIRITVRYLLFFGAPSMRQPTSICCLDRPLVMASFFAGMCQCLFVPPRKTSERAHDYVWNWELESGRFFLWLLFEREKFTFFQHRKHCLVASVWWNGFAILFFCVHNCYDCLRLGPLRVEMHLFSLR